ncbi:hypothetical protein GWI33_004808 [Rhynchophorus ferrugineus]|uniref:Reverse transcriptase zinc-binding domain-containing protein n=1 Tax=Rhynchophorus ferrugineus TaxID=354439 RepID=A0A834IP07_RHYFE|nr:hypothetical protein GWI33_004808 [Rhynchophorus ferrugineus]
MKAVGKIKVELRPRMPVFCDKHTSVDWLSWEVPMNYHLTQALKGHGVFRSYLKKIGKTQTDECWYCGEADTPSHTLFVCHEWLWLREGAEETVGERVTVDSTRSPLGGKMKGKCEDEMRKWRQNR